MFKASFFCKLTKIMRNAFDLMISVQPFVVSILDAGQKIVSSVNFSEEHYHAVIANLSYAMHGACNL